LSCYPHPRDKRACLPKISSPHNLYKNLLGYKSKISSKYKEINQNKFQKYTFYSKISYFIENFQKRVYQMAAKLNLDKLDLQIIHEMLHGEDVPYAELGKKLFVSGGTIHVRIKKLEELGIVKGKRIAVDLKQLGYDISAFVGVYLEKSSLYDVVAKELEGIPQIVRLNYTTGNYSMFIEIVCKDINELRTVLHDDLQNIKGIERTETFISLDEGFNRNVLIAPKENV
jgi:Lrp/AsnC family transcriptional regulator, regulator for asnA, asnC and gidA